MPTSNQPLLAAVTQHPLLISPGSERLFQNCVEHVVKSEHSEAMLSGAVSASNDEEFWPQADDWRAALRPYNVKNGVLQIPVMGVLLNRFGYQYGRWATGYTYIEKALERGLADGNVRAIAFVCDSPGGEVAGCFELADKIYGARGEKPMRAFAADHAYSAAFALASSANDIVVTRSGGVGSVGVLTTHVEYSKMLDNEGIKVTFIFAGQHKVDGNAYEKLPENVKSRIQDRINRIYGEFTGLVARNRKLDEKAVRATEALTYDANEAVEIGFADRVGALEDEMAIFSQELTQTENEQMSEKVENKGVDQATHESAVAAARIEGATAERTRIATILTSDEGKARPKAAMSLAMKTDMGADTAKAVLADMPEEKAEKATNTRSTTGKTPFETAMETTENPNVGADGGEEHDDGRNSDDKAAASILSDYAGITGFRRKKSA